MKHPAFNSRHCSSHCSNYSTKNNTASWFKTIMYTKFSTFSSSFNHNFSSSDILGIPHLINLHRNQSFQCQSTPKQQGHSPPAYSRLSPPPPAYISHRTGWQQPQQPAPQQPQAIPQPQYPQPDPTFPNIPVEWIAPNQNLQQFPGMQQPAIPLGQQFIMPGMPPQAVVPGIQPQFPPHFPLQFPPHWLPQVALPPVMFSGTPPPFFIPAQQMPPNPYLWGANAGYRQWRNE